MAEPAKKYLLLYLQRADELQKHEPLVAYYCRLYAMERGLKIPVKERTKTTNQILVSLMNQLEKDKKVIQSSPEDSLHVEGFALSVFAKADKQDRSGQADLNTAKTFYAASLFIEILQQFGPLDPDIEQKQKYAVWKAADIRKAINDGRKPVPGPPGGDDELLDSSKGASFKRLDSTGTRSPELKPDLPQPPTTRGFLDDRATRPPDDGSLSQQPPHARFSTPSPNQVLQPDNVEHSGNNQHGMPQPPHDSSHHGYTTYPISHYSPVNPTTSSGTQYGSMPLSDAYSGPSHSESYNHDYLQTSTGGFVHPNVPTTYVDTPTSLSGSQYGSVPHSDAYGGQPHNEMYINDYAQNPMGGSVHPNMHSVQTGFVHPNIPPTQTGFAHPNMATTQTSFARPNMPTTHVGSSGGLEETSTYYQSQEGPSPSIVTYPSSLTPVNARYGSFNEHTNGLERMASAPLPTSKAEHYQPPPDKIAEAQKAAKFAVSALSFDDIPTAISYLQRSIELLTRPSLA